MSSFAGFQASLSLVHLSDSVFLAEAASIHQLESCNTRYLNSIGYCYRFAFELFKQPLAHRPFYQALLAK